MIADEDSNEARLRRTGTLGWGASAGGPTVAKGHQQRSCAVSRVAEGPCALERVAEVVSRASYAVASVPEEVLGGAASATGGGGTEAALRACRNTSESKPVVRIA